MDRIENDNPYDDYRAFRALPIHRVSVLDESGKEVLRGYYVLHFKRTLCPFDDEYKEDDVEHLVIYDEDSDWNMPRGIRCAKITPPHKIVFFD